MIQYKTALLAGAVALVGFAGAAHAGYDTGSFNMTVFTGNTNGNGFAATATANPFTGSVAEATFTYTGALGFDNTAAQNSGNNGDLNSTFFASAGDPAPSYGISNFKTVNAFASGSSAANFSNLSSFLSSSGSASSYQWGSFYEIDLGTLAKGTVITFTHDDGATVYQGSNQVGTSTSGPTTVITDTVELSSTGDTMLYYSRQNGTPSILEVSVPEPISMTLFGTGLIGLGVIVRRRQSATTPTGG